MNFEWMTVTVVGMVMIMMMIWVPSSECMGFNEFRKAQG